MRARWALLVLCAAGCAEEELVFRGDWSCEDKPNRRPTWTFEAKVLGPAVEAVFAEPVYKNLVTLGVVELERGEGRTWVYEGKLPTDLEVGFELGGEDIGVEESCKDVTSILYEVVLRDGDAADFQVKKASRGDKQTK